MASLTEAQNLAALLPAIKAPLVLGARPMPKLTPRGVIIRNHAVAINPVDWKMRDSGFRMPALPTVLGSDVAGIVQAVGPDVTRFKPGDRVAGFASILATGDADNGALQTYTRCEEYLVVGIPGRMGFQEAALLPMAIVTSGFAIFWHIGVPRRVPATPKQPLVDGASMLIWGGASSMGSAAIQIAHKVGYTVYATASTKHHAYLRELGADHLFDYREPGIVETISTLSNKDSPLAAVYDAIGTDESLPPCAEILLASRSSTTSDKKIPKKLVAVRPWRLEKPVPEEISFEVVNQRQFDVPEMTSWLFWNWLTPALEDGSFVPSPSVRLVEGGLSSAEEALLIGKAGSLSGEKLVIEVKRV